MMKLFRASILVLAAALPAASPTLAAAPSRAARADAAASLTIPFAPTIGQPIHLHSERSVINVRHGTETPAEQSTSDEELIFAERNAEGYVLRWTTRAVSVHTAPDRQALMERVGAAAIGKTALIQTDAQGVPVRLINVAEMRALLSSALDLMTASIDRDFAASPQPERDMMRQAIGGIAQMYRDMSDERIGEIVLDDPKTLFGLGGSAMTRGRAMPFRTEIVLPVAGTPVAIAGTVELRESAPDELLIAIDSASDPEAIRLAVKTYLDKALAKIAPDQRDAIVAAAARLTGFEAKNEMLLTLDAANGLVRRASYRKYLGFKEQSRLETKSYSVVP
jgi:hypothetical protein